MESNRADTRKIILNYGLLLGILMVVLGVIMYVTDYHLEPHWSFMLASFIIFAAVEVLGIKAFKQDNNDFLSMSESIKTAVGIALVSGIISGIWIIILTTYIEPDYMNLMIEVQREAMLERYPEMTDEQIEQGLEMSSRFMSPWISFGVGIVRDLFFGLLLGLVVGAILKQRRPFEV